MDTCLKRERGPELELLSPDKQFGSPSSGQESTTTTELTSFLFLDSRSPSQNKHPPGQHHVRFMSQLHLLLNVRLDALADRQQHLRKRYGLPLAR